MINPFAKKESKNSKKPAGTEQSFFTVSIGYNKLYFRTREEALKVFDAITNTSLLKIDHTMVDKWKEESKDYSGYEYLYYVDRPQEVTLGSETVIIYNVGEAEAYRAQVKEEVAAFEQKVAESKPKGKKKV